MNRFPGIIKRLFGIPILKLHRILSALELHASRDELRTQLGRVGQSFEITPPWDIRAARYVFIGDDVYIGPDVLMIANQGAEIRLGNKIMFGPRVRVIADHHRHDVPTIPIRDSGYQDQAPIVIEDDVWIGTGATLLKGVRVGRGAVVGAGAVVTKDVPPLEIWAGNPAKCVKLRFQYPARVGSGQSSGSE